MSGMKKYPESFDGISALWYRSSMTQSISAADKRVQGLVGKAIRDYDMIEAGDRVAVAVSGGKDSMALLHLLKARLKWIPIRYDLLAVHLDMGFEGAQPQRIEQACRELEVPFYFEQTDYGIKGPWTGKQGKPLLSVFLVAAEASLSTLQDFEVYQDCLRT